MKQVFDCDTMAVNLRNACDIKRACNPGSESPISPSSSARGTRAATESTTLSAAVEEIERRMIKDALSRSSGNIAKAAKDLGLSRKGLYLKMDRLNF